MKIALLQTAGDPANSPSANLDRLDDAAGRAKAGGAALLLPARGDRGSPGDGEAHKATIGRVLKF